MARITKQAMIDQQAEQIDALLRRINELENALERFAIQAEPATQPNISPRRAAMLAARAEAQRSGRPTLVQH